MSCSKKKNGVPDGPSGLDRTQGFRKNFRVDFMTPTTSTFRVEGPYADSEGKGSVECSKMASPSRFSKNSSILRHPLHNSCSTPPNDQSKLFSNCEECLHHLKSIEKTNKRTKKLLSQMKLRKGTAMDQSASFQSPKFDEVDILADMNQLHYMSALVNLVLAEVTVIQDHFQKLNGEN